MDTLISVDEALRRLLDATHPLAPEERLLEDALGLVTVESVRARTDSPPFARAMLDGFAVRAEDVAGATRDAPRTLRVLGTVGAGSGATRAIGQGEAVRTMTGAPMSPGADALLRIEYAQEFIEQGERVVHAYRSVPVDEAVQQRGDDLRAGEVALAAGTLLLPAQIGILASHGYRSIAVVRPPRVAVVATGSELLEAGEAPHPHALYNSNGPMLCALIRRVGGIAQVIPAVGDDLSLQQRVFSDALKDVDVLVTTGGVSVGDFDLTPSALEAIGVERLFWGVFMRPGTPVYAGMRGKQVILAFSGSPSAALVNAVVLGLPVLRRLAGQKDPAPALFARVTGATLRRRVKHSRFFRGQLTQRDAEWWIDLGTEQSSGSFSGFASVTALARVDADADVTDGALVPIFLLP
ncbi:gephyrin-like molybdotransferase Glp [Ferroacidibacillus organovorans]|nr:gephyrin-like molybdotransferase Glp [Ferroacidibacillus organovorans]